MRCNSSFIQILLSLVVWDTPFVQAIQSEGYIAVDYCPSEKDVLLPFHSVYGPYDAIDWNGCAALCEASNNANDDSPLNMVHIPNTYCKYYAQGGDGPCESGRTFSDVYEQCDNDGPEKCMGIMWNACESPTSNTEVNGAWKLMTAGQNVGDANNPTSDCGGKEQAKGQWDVFLRAPEGPEQCQFAYFNDGKCYIYGKKVVKTDPLELEPSVFKNMECDDAKHGSGGRYVLREFQYATQYGKEAPVGGLGHELRKKINEETANLDNGAFGTNISMETTFLGETFTRFCDNGAWRTVNKCPCAPAIVKAKELSKCGETEGSIKIKWSTSLSDLDDLAVDNISVGDFWRSGFKDHVMRLLDKSAVKKGEAYKSMECFGCCQGCNTPRKKKRGKFTSMGYVSEMMPEEMDFKLVRYKEVIRNDGEAVDIIANFAYQMEGLDRYKWDETATHDSYCSGSSSAVSVTLGVLSLLTAPIGIGPIFGAAALTNNVACMASATAPPPPPPPAPAPSSCMAGKTGVVSLVSSHNREEGSIRSLKPPRIEKSKQITKVRDLQVDNIILGLDESKQVKECRVEAVGSFGFGPVYGNYTDDHFVLNPTTGDVEVHGKKGDAKVEDKYIVLTSCPLGLDESGIGFTPFDSDFFGDLTKDLTWKDYLLLHTAILRVVRETGTFWFNGDSYKDLKSLRHHAPLMGKTLLQCMKDHNDCEDLENASLFFIEKALADHTKTKAYDIFHNLGNHRELGSAAAVVSAGKSHHDVG